MADIEQPNAPKNLPSELTIERMQALREKRTGRQGSKWNPEMQETFLDLYREFGSIRKCAEALGISTTAIYKHRNGDPEFDEQCIQAEEDFSDGVDENITDRAVNGTQEPLVYQGKIMKDEAGHPVMVTRHSDRLAELVVKAQKPDKYRERREITGAGGGDFSVVVKSLNDMIAETKPAEKKQLPKPKPTEDEK